MKMYENYVGYNLTKFFFDKKETEFCIIRTKVRGKWCIRAYGDIYHLKVMLGLTIINSMIIECKQDETDNAWFIKIDMNEEGKF